MSRPKLKRLPGEPYYAVVGADVFGRQYPEPEVWEVVPPTPELNHFHTERVEMVSMQTGLGVIPMDVCMDVWEPDELLWWE